jgi:hypothetical protein
MTAAITAAQKAPGPIKCALINIGILASDSNMNTQAHADVI